MPVSNSPIDNHRKLTISNCLRSCASIRPDRTAIRMGDQSLTYSQLITRIDKISAGGLGYFNIKPGDRVALILPNCLQYMEMVAGFSQIGAPCAMIPPMASPP